MSDRLTRISEWSRMIATWFGIFTAFSSFLLGLRAYQEREAARADLARQELEARIEAEKKRADEHVTLSFSFVEGFHSPQLIGIRNNLIAATTFAQKQCAPIHGGASPLSTQEYFTLVEYFDRAQYCVTAGLCAGEVMAQLLSPYADAWWPVLRTAIEETRQHESTFRTERPFGFGLEALATSPRQAVEIRCAAAKK